VQRLQPVQLETIASCPARPAVTAGVPCPAIELRDAAQRLDNYAPEVHAFTGPALLHTDLNHANVIVGADGARIVDWGWATRGAPWLDAAYWVVWLIASGHDPADAEQWASKVCTWTTATDAGLDAFADAQAAVWAEIGARDPDDPWTGPLVTAAHDWARFRGSTPPAPQAGS
jgi:Ser/Thr protein kinase RdoA (MazF antagonist)